jgi:hypothetical protein
MLCPLFFLFGFSDSGELLDCEGVTKADISNQLIRYGELLTFNASLVCITTQNCAFEECKGTAGRCGAVSITGGPRSVTINGTKVL